MPLTAPPNLSALYEVVQGYGEEWKKVWKWTLPVTRDGGGQVLARGGVSRDELRPPHLPPSQYSPDRLKRAACNQRAYMGPRGYPPDNVVTL